MILVLKYVSPLITVKLCIVFVKLGSEEEVGLFS